MADGDEQEQLTMQDVLAAGGRAMRLYERATTALRALDALVDIDPVEPGIIQSLVEIGLDKDIDKAEAPEQKA